MTLQEPPVASDIFLGMDQFELVKKLSFVKRICRKVPSAVKKLDWIEKHTTEQMNMPIYQAEFKLRAVLLTGLIPLDVIGEVNKASSQMYDLLLEHQKETIFG